MRQAVEVLTTAADRGHVDAGFQLGRIYEIGVGVAAQRSRAENWYRWAAERGSEPAQTRLRNLTGEGAKCPYTDNVDPEYRTGVLARWPKPNYFTHEAEFHSWLHEVLADWWQELADAGQSWANRDYARVLRHGHGRDVNPAEAVARYRRAAEGGDWQAIEELAQYILENKPATTSAEEALQLILLAAQVSGNASCMIRAGDYLRDGIGGPVDLAEAANWYRKAAECEQMLFKNEELVNYLSAVKVSKSVYEYVVYDSDVERKFAEQLDQREDIKLFVKLPGWFEIDTPIGKYNPDWAILKHDGQALYLVRETKGTRDFLKLRTSEADKVNCGKRHFEAIGVDFAVAVTVEEV